MDDADDAVGDAAVAVADFIVDVGRSEHRTRAPVEVGLVETALEAALASLQLSAYPGVHSKSLVWRGC
jgi:hypothetical protein